MRGIHRMLLLLLAARACLAAGSDPNADPKAMVTAGDARFTVLTPQLIRMEWSADGRFEEHASLVFLNRRLPVPRFISREEEGWLLVKTDQLELRYKRGSGKFRADNLAVSLRLNGKEIRWTPELPDTANLRGTTRTLDGVRGATALEPGLLSRDGWALVDDSNRPLFDGSEWSWVMDRPEGDRQDLYFFGYGHEYKKALFDFTRVSGKIPMPPRFAFGLWWSRYWAYTDEEFKELVRAFEVYSVPLDVLVIDMDWHLTFNMRWSKDVRDQAGQQLGWTGYTWDKNYFPDPRGFLGWCESKGLKTPLNLHPASGIQPHEEHYPEMARSMGIDPGTQKYVPFDIVNKKFATNYMNLIIRPLERLGVDFWWLDWQQWSTTTIAGVSPTWWLNYVFFTDMARKNGPRPLLFHRWGGLGNHRYQIGFSGDTYSVWESLAFQPYFTSTAANVGFGYWSHDIGGHMPGVIAPELYTRWLQFGAFSPVVRTHTTKNPAAERRIWAYPVDYFLAMRDAVLLRYALIPYIYTFAREAYETGVSLCRPMYYDYPESPEAYEFSGQYMFGDRMLVAPVVAALDTLSMLATQRVWLPEGEWVEWFTGSRLTGPGVHERRFALDEVPVYVKAGSVIPMQPALQNAGLQKPDPCILTVFPGSEGTCSLYEDEGNTQGYQGAAYARTEIRQTTAPDGSTAIVIGPAKGTYPGMPRERRYEIRLEGVLPPSAVRVNGKPIAWEQDHEQPGWWYDGDMARVVVNTPPQSVSASVKVEFTYTIRPAERIDVGGLRGTLARLRRVMPWINGFWPKEWSPELLIHAAQTGNRMGLDPASASRELDTLRVDLPRIVEEVGAIAIDTATKSRVLRHLEDIRSQQVQER